MEDKTKLYVFERKEVALIFIFMILISSTCFILGIKIGKNYSLRMTGVQEGDRQKVELMSADEENVQEVINSKKDSEGANPEALKETAFLKLKEKIDNEFSDRSEKGESPAPSTLEKKSDNSEKSNGTAADGLSGGDANTNVPTEKVETSSATSQDGQNSDTPKDQYAGKYTIQLGSHRSMQDAEKFADGFRVRGYNPIINEVKIKERGVWYRVSLGVFDSIAEAKDYIVKEKTLFQDLDYVIGRFD